jgi:hypothetical protein
MKTAILTTLLLAGMLVPMTTALADPLDDFWAIEACVEAIIGPDGQNEQVLVELPVDVIDQRPECLN